MNWSALEVGAGWLFAQAQFARVIARRNAECLVRRADDERNCPARRGILPQAARSSSKPAVHLSAREEEVLILLSKGYSNKEIASQLSIGVETIGSHLKHIYGRQMHVRSLAEAVARYMTDKT